MKECSGPQQVRPFPPFLQTQCWKFQPVWLSVEKKKRYPDQKQRNKTLYLQMTWLSVESPKKSTKEVIEVRGEASKLTEHNRNILKSIVFLYTSNEHLDIEVKNIISFTIIQINESRYKPNKTHVELLYWNTEKEMKEYLNKW